MFHGVNEIVNFGKGTSHVSADFRRIKKEFTLFLFFGVSRDCSKHSVKQGTEYTRSFIKQD